MKPILGITMGDPYGNGPEVTVKALGDAAVYDRCRPVVIGDAACMRYAAAAVRTRCGIQVQIHPIKAISEALFVPGVIDVYDMELVDEADIPGDPENPQPFGCGIGSIFCKEMVGVILRILLHLGAEGIVAHLLCQCGNIGE